VGQNEAKADAAVVEILLDAIAPPHSTMQIPVMVAAAAQTTLATTTIEWATIGWY
jgi:hypothetical protein